MMLAFVLWILKKKRKKKYLWPASFQKSVIYLNMKKDAVEECITKQSLCSYYISSAYSTGKKTSFFPGLCCQLSLLCLRCRLSSTFVWCFLNCSKLFPQAVVKIGCCILHLPLVTQEITATLHTCSSDAFGKIIHII